MPLVHRLLKPVITLLFLAMTLITFLATMGRMVPAAPSLYWAGEATRYLNFWITCIGIGLAVPLGAHFRLTMLTDSLPRGLRRGVAATMHLGVLILAGVLVHYGIQMITWNFDQLSAAMEVPMSYVYLAIPVCGVLVALASIMAILRLLRGGDDDPQPGTASPDAGIADAGRRDAARSPEPRT